jgi:pSer/pThr/pTyr-binding forkhead associated (FHA) protein
MPQMRIKVMTQRSAYVNNYKSRSDQLPKHNMKIVLGDFIAKLWREGIFKPAVWGSSEM